MCVCSGEAEEFSNRLQATRQRVSELERTLSSVSTQQKQYDKVIVWLYNDMGKRFSNSNINIIFGPLTYRIYIKYHRSDQICLFLLVCLFLLSLQHNKELEKERDNLRLEVYRLK